MPQTLLLLNFNVHCTSHKSVLSTLFLPSAISVVSTYLLCSAYSFLRYSSCSFIVYQEKVDQLRKVINQVILNKKSYINVSYLQWIQSCGFLNFNNHEM